MRRGAHTIERFAQYVRPIELLEKAFRLAGLEIEYAVTYVGDYKAFEIFYYPILFGCPSVPWGFEGLGPVETVSDMAF